MLHEPLISAYPKETGSEKPRLNQENPGKVACFGQRSHLSSPGRPSYAAGSCLCRRSWWPRSPPSRGSSRTSPWRRCPPRASDRARTSPPSYARRRPSLPFPSLPPKAQRQANENRSVLLAPPQDPFLGQGGCHSRESTTFMVATTEFEETRWRGRRERRITSVLSLSPPLSPLPLIHLLVFGVCPETANPLPP